jgi:hypothetical protein
MLKFKKLVSLIAIITVLMAFLAIINVIPIVKATEPTGRTNGLTLVLDSTGGHTVAQIISFMETYHYNALKMYVGWCSSYFGSAWTGNYDNPIPTSAKTKISQLIGNCSARGWLVECTISDQISPAKTNDTWHDYEVQVGWAGPNSDLNSNDNWLDYTGPCFIRHQTALVKTFVGLMDDYMRPRIGLEEMQYVSGGGHPAFYAQCMKDAYLADTGLAIPYFASTSTSEGSWTSDQWNFINYVNATIKGFYEDMWLAALSINSTAILHVMTDDLVYYEAGSPYIYYTQPLDFFGNSTVFEATEIECYGKVGSGNWAGLQDVLDMCTSWNPSAKQYFTYGKFSGASASEIETAITQAMDSNYDGVWAYGYASGGSSFHDSPQDVSDLIPNTAYSDVSYNTTIAGASCKFSSHWTDSSGLSGYKFSWNGTGSWINNTWTTFNNATSAWANVTKTLPAASTVVGFKWYVNSTANYDTTTSIYTLTTTGAGVNSLTLSTPSDANSTHVKTVTFSYTPIMFQTIKNSSLWLNSSGTWQNVANNASAVTNNIVNSISYTFTISAIYIWNIKAYNTTYGVSAAANHTLTVSVEPYFGVISTNTTHTNYPCLFQAYLYDGDGLSKAILSTNITGSMVNETAKALSGTSYIANWTKTLPSTYGVYVLYRIFVNDTDANWATSNDYMFQLETTTITITISNPVATIYYISSISVTISVTVTGATADKTVYNVKNVTSWKYGSNQTYTSPTLMTSFITGTYTFWVWANATDGTIESATVQFSVSIPASGHAAFRISTSSAIIIQGVTFTNCAIGIQSDGAGINNQFYGNNMTGCTWKFVWNGTVSGIIHDNYGYNPVGIVAVSVSITGSYLVDAGSSSMQSGVSYTCTQSNKIIYISGTVSTIRINGIVVFSGDVNVAIPLKPNDVFMVEWSTQPSIYVMVQ